MKWDATSIDTFMAGILNTAYFEPDPDHNNTPAIEGVMDKGECPLVLITGPNASGKSLIRRLVSQALKMADVECIHLSQEGRCTGGIQRAMIYGTEEWESTGAITSHTVLMGVKTAHSRERRHCIFWDEPDIGLSDDYAAGAGIEIANFVRSLPTLTFGVFVVTHSRALARELEPVKPYHLRLGGYPDLVTWLDMPIVPKSLGSLKDESHERFRRIQEILNRGKKK